MIFFQEKDLNNADKYADLALRTDKFNPAGTSFDHQLSRVHVIRLCLALTNKGNCCYAHEDYEKARYYYEEALNIDAGSVEALHNLSESFLAFACQRFSFCFTLSSHLDEIQSIPACQRFTSQVPHHSTEQLASVLSHGASPAANQRCGECEELVSTLASMQPHTISPFTPPGIFKPWAHIEWMVTCIGAWAK